MFIILDRDMQFYSQLYIPRMGQCCVNDMVKLPYIVVKNFLSHENCIERIWLMPINSAFEDSRLFRYCVDQGTPADKKTQVIFSTNPFCWYQLVSNGTEYVSLR